MAEPFQWPPDYSSNNANTYLHVGHVFGENCPTGQAQRLHRRNTTVGKMSKHYFMLPSSKETEVQLRTIQRGEGCTGNLTFKTESGE